MNSTELRILIIAAICLILSGTAAGDSGCRYFWLVRDDLSSPGEIDAMLAAASEAGANGVIAQVIGRAEAYYCSDLLPPASFSEGFDPLGYLVAKAGPMGLEVHAWVNAFLVWSAPWSPSDSSHVYHARPGWFMTDRNGRSTKHYSSDECQSAGLVGATLSPAEPEVRELLADIAGEIALSYDVDGIHLDYIRYPNASFGFENQARMKFFFDTGIDPPSLYRGFTSPAQELLDAWGSWREEQVTETVRTIRARLDAVAPRVLLTCAVMADPFDAKSQYSCNWRQWLLDGDVDLVCTMAYTTNLNRARQLAVNGTNICGDRVVHGIGIYNQSISSALTGAEEALSRGSAGVCVFSLNSLDPDRAWVIRDFWRREGELSHMPDPALFYRVNDSGDRR